MFVCRRRIENLAVVIVACQGLVASVEDSLQQIASTVSPVRVLLFLWPVETEITFEGVTVLPLLSLVVGGSGSIEDPAALELVALEYLVVVVLRFPQGPRAGRPRTRICLRAFEMVLQGPFGQSVGFSRPVTHAGRGRRSRELAGGLAGHMMILGCAFGRRLCRDIRPVGL